MKETYKTPVLDVEVFEIADVITESDPGSNVETPIR